MKNAVLRRVAALLLAAVITVAASACASFADLVTGFADAATYMRGETNVRSEMTLSLKTSDSAKPLSFGDLLRQSMAYSESYDESVLNALATDLNMGLSVVTEVYEDTALVSLGWLGENGQTEPLMTLIVVDQTIYISTELLGYVSELGLPAEYNEVASLIDCDYIKVNLDTLSALTEGSLAVAEAQTESQTEALRAAVDKLINALRDYTPKVLTEQYADTLKRESGGYTLTLNAETTVALFNEILNMAEEYESEILAFLRETSGELGLDEASLDSLNLKQSVSEMRDALATAQIGTDIPNFDLIYKVSGTGKDASKKQTSSVKLTLPEIPDAPFDTLTIESQSVTTIVTQPVAVPTGNVLSLEELMMQLMFTSSMASNWE